MPPMIHVAILDDVEEIDLWLDDDIESDLEDELSK